MRETKGILSGIRVLLVVLLLLFATGTALAQQPTQGELALNLASMLGLTLPPGATQADAVSALNALGISPAGGWSPNAPADSGVISSVFTSLSAAYSAGRVAPTAGLGNPSATLAAAATASGIPSNTVVGAITGAGGNAGQASQGASQGASAGAGGGPGGGSGGGAGGSGGGGGGGGTLSPST